MIARERHKAWPNVPAIAETFSDFRQIAFLGRGASAGAPADILNALHGHVVGALSGRAIRSRLEPL